MAQEAEVRNAGISGLNNDLRAIDSVLNAKPGAGSAFSSILHLQIPSAFAFSSIDDVLYSYGVWFVKLEVSRSLPYANTTSGCEILEWQQGNEVTHTVVIYNQRKRTSAVTSDKS